MSLASYEVPTVGTDAGYLETVEMQRDAARQAIVAPHLAELYADNFGIELDLQ